MSAPTRLASHVVKAGRFTYFFDVNESKSGEVLYLTINQSRYKGEGEEREYQRLTIFADSVKDFYEGLCEAIRSFKSEQKEREEFEKPVTTQAQAIAAEERDIFADE